MLFPNLDPPHVSDESVLNRAQRYLAAAHDSVSSLLDVTYPALRSQRDAQRGRLTHAEQDLFRAAVVFAGAGLDAVLKEAIRAALPIRVDQSEHAKEKYLDFVTRYIQRGSELDARRVASLLTAPSSHDDLKISYVDKLTGSSLQSVSQVHGALSALGLDEATELFKDARDLTELFSARNQIAHELDMTRTSAQGRGARHRRERPVDKYVTLCHTGLNFAQKTLNALAKALSPR